MKVSNYIQIIESTAGLVLAVLAVVLLFRAFLVLPEKPIIAVANIDTVGHYLLTNYTIDKHKCLNFIDATNNLHHFCGAYGIITEKELVETQIKMLHSQPEP